MIAHPTVRRWLENTARDHDIPYQLEVLEFGSTDASAVQISRAGVPAGTISVPCRYIHTPSQVADYNDARNAVSLLVHLLRDDPAILADMGGRTVDTAGVAAGERDA